VSSLFASTIEDVRTAGSICLGNISIGNTDYFLERVFALVDKSVHQEKYLFLNTIREIIIHNSRCLGPYLARLLPLLVEHSKNEEEQIRNIVAESVGRLFIVYSVDMYNDIEECFKSGNVAIRSTIVKSFKYAGAKETDSVSLEMCHHDLIKLVEDSDLSVKKNALEALNAIVHNQPSVVRSNVDKLQKVVVPETQIKAELITEVDLGPFKHKIDDGIPIRKAAYTLIDSLIEKLPERVEINQVIEVVTRGLDDAAEECMILCLHILGRLIAWAPTVVISNLDPLVESFEKQFQKNLKLISNTQSSEKAQNIMRAILRVVEQLQRTPDSDTNNRFNEFFKGGVMSNTNAKEMYEKIAATAS
jgi:cullin-associated NEDD8-dissociated protein 1